MRYPLRWEVLSDNPLRSNCGYRCSPCWATARPAAYTEQAMSDKEHNTHSKTGHRDRGVERERASVHSQTIRA
jgi:hypothetical protein